jgi:hypothetical protein
LSKLGVRRVVRLALVLGSVLALGFAAPAAATTTTLIAPYAADRSWTSCDPTGHGYCDSDASATAATGIIATTTQVGAPAFSSSSDGAQSQAFGDVSTKAIKTSPKARSIRATVTIRVNAASSTPTGAQNDEFRRARTFFNVHLGAWCSGCPDGGYKESFQHVPVTDTDPLTAEPDAVDNDVRVITVDLALAPNETFNGAAWLWVSGGGRAWMWSTNPINPFEVSARSSITMTLERASVTV